MSKTQKFRLSGRERWKLKKWFTVLAPEAFGSVPIATIPADEPWKLLGRKIEVTLYDLTGDVTQVHVRLYFQIWKVEGLTAYTRFSRFELARDYVRGLTRRKSSKVTAITNVFTKDGYKIRVTAITWTTYRCKTSQISAIRKAMMELINSFAAEHTLDELLLNVVSGELQQKLFEAAKKIYPIRKAEIYKIKLLAIPTPEGLKKAIITPRPGLLEAPYGTTA